MEAHRSCAGFNTQPPEGGWLQGWGDDQIRGNGFNTQPPEGGWICQSTQCKSTFISFNTQPPEGGWADNYDVLRLVIEFQHTAA